MKEVVIACYLYIFWRTLDERRLLFSLINYLSLFFSFVANDLMIIRSVCITNNSATNFCFKKINILRKNIKQKSLNQLLAWACMSARSNSCFYTGLYIDEFIIVLSRNVPILELNVIKLENKSVDKSPCGIRTHVSRMMFRRAIITTPQPH